MILSERKTICLKQNKVLEVEWKYIIMKCFWPVHKTITEEMQMKAFQTSFVSVIVKHTDWDVVGNWIDDVSETMVVRIIFQNSRKILFEKNDKQTGEKDSFANVMNSYLT